MIEHWRIVTDANIIVSAVLKPGSTPALAYQLAKKGTLLASAQLLGELVDVLQREKFDRYLDLDTRLEYLAAFGLLAERVLITETITTCRDPKDNHLLELAVCGQATHIITGDADLLALHPFRGISIVTPADFVALFPSPPVAPTPGE